LNRQLLSTNHQELSERTRVRVTSCRRLLKRDYNVSKWNQFGITLNGEFGSRRGGRGFNSSKRGHPATAPTLMRRFFSGVKTFDYFSGNQIFKRRSRQFLLTKQGGLAIEVLAFEHLFSRRGDGRAIRKTVAKFPGGGMTTASSEVAT
jgi:hypothetical protein